MRASLKILGEGGKPPPGYHKIRCHIIFDIKMEDFRRKSRLVAGGHVTEPPYTITYESVVSRETVLIALTVAPLDDFQMNTADIQNSYIQAPVAEKICTVLGPEFGPDTGKSTVVVRYFYGIKSTGASFLNHLADCINHMEYIPCPADPDLWMKTMVILSDGTEYYAYILLYFDDIVCIHYDAKIIIKKVDKFLRLKPDSIGDPDMYLVAKVRPMKFYKGVWAWALSPSPYVQESCRNGQKYMNNNIGVRWKLTSPN